MKKISIIILLIITIIILSWNQITTYRCKDINYAVERCMTTGIFNKYKLYQVESTTLTFSDGTMAMVKVEGFQSHSPHNRASYSVLMEKNKNGVWKRKNIYPTKNAIKGD